MTPRDLAVYLTALLLLAAAASASRTLETRSGIPAHAHADYRLAAAGRRLNQDPAGLAADRNVQDPACHDRKLLDVNVPLTIKLFYPVGGWCGKWLEDTVAADIAAADTWAAANGRQRLAYAGLADLATDLGTFDMLLVHAYCSFPGWISIQEVFTATQAAAVSTALGTGTLKKLMVWHAWNYGGNNRVPGLYPDSGCSWSNFAYYIDANPLLYATVGTSPSGASIFGAGGAASHGSCPAAGVAKLNKAMVHTWMTGVPAFVTGFSYCYGGRGAVFYSQTPMDSYLQQFPDPATAPADYRAIRELHINALGVFTNDIHCQRAPTCPLDVVASRTWLPPNNKLFPVSIQGIPIQDPTLPGTVEVTGVQFFDALKGAKPTFPLAAFAPGPTAGQAIVQLRAERNGAGRGRLYRIQYKAGNAVGSCTGSVFVCVPHDASAFTPLSPEEVAALVAAQQMGGGSRKTTCPMPSAIAEGQWMPTGAPAAV